MKSGRILLLAMALGLSTSAFAGEEMQMKIAVVKDGGDGDVRIELDSDDIGFNLDELQEGESRSVVDKSGQSILITRTAEGYTFNVDGETIDMPMIGGDHDGLVWIGEDGDTDVDFHVMRKAKFIGEDRMGGTMIMSAEPIDETTQQLIKSALESAGHEAEVHFATHEMHHRAGYSGMHRVKVIEKLVEVKE